ncbi:glycosyltransferase family 4 protein [Desertivirga brevis]|uniref:glycosyltransferase family 4 protein n=1 Tax=Desertivirga brevis TaxID=2810310 RepID=UPI001A96DD78|nr:glycosyltransferase family 4 protein [Pedobacter sp. SYSU D00873]
MNIIVSHPTGNRNVRAVISSLNEAGMLAGFNTTLATNPKAGWINLLPAGLRQEWLRRTFPIPREKIWTHPSREFARMLLPKVGLKSYTRHEFGWACVDAVYRDFDRVAAKRLLETAGKQRVQGVYAYEDGALETFKAAKKIGLKCIYDLPIAYWETGRKLMYEEAERLPGWANTLGGGIKDSDGKLARKTEELDLADVVVGPGKFVLDSLPDWARDKEIYMAPFGSPKPATIKDASMARKDSKKPLRVLFAGSMGQRKGLGDLFAAIRLLNRNDVELVVMGALQAPMEFYRNELFNFTYEAGRPHDQVLELMRSCDVFCLPSIVEGRALVMQEAMSQGLPLIITPNTGGADLIIEGETGFLVPIRSPEIIAEKILWFLNNRDQIAEMGKKAIEHSALYTWENYGSGIVKSLLRY